MEAATFSSFYLFIVKEEEATGNCNSHTRAEIVFQQILFWSRYLLYSLGQEGLKQLALGMVPIGQMAPKAATVRISEDLSLI